MRIHDVIVIGAGLFGQTIAKTLRHQGRTVMVVDARLPGSGSRPAACIMKPSWYESLGTDIFTPGLDLLNEIYGLKSITFEQYPTARAKSQLPKTSAYALGESPRYFAGRSSEACGGSRGCAKFGCTQRSNPIVCSVGGGCGGSMGGGTVAPIPTTIVERHFVFLAKHPHHSTQFHSSVCPISAIHDFRYEWGYLGWRRHGYPTKELDG